MDKSSYALTAAEHKDRNMSQCYNTGDFKKYFIENMKDLNLSVPANLFDTSEKAISTAALMLGALHTLGKRATIAELVGATVGLEKLLIISALSASGYVSAVIGSIVVATGRSLGCGHRIADMFVLVEKNHLKFNNWRVFYTINPQILDRNYPARDCFGLKCTLPNNAIEIT